MLQSALIFLGIAIIAAIFGFGGVAGSATGIAQFLFVLFLVAFLITLVRGLMDRRRSSPW
jgi:uncharacterized membrane protein YtjA (UPF0391 family)